MVTNKEILLKEMDKGIILRNVNTQKERGVRNLKQFYGLDQAKTRARVTGQPYLKDIDYSVKNLIIDFVQDYQKQGHNLDDAVREAGAIRLRPILLTTLAIALGTAIMVPDAVFGGLALALIFGAISSALLVIVIVPLLYRRMMQDQVNDHLPGK